MTATIPNVWFTESTQSLPPAASPATDVDSPSASVAPNSACSPCADALLPSRESPPDLSGVSVQERPLVDLESDTQHIVELFSDYARRRCMDKISPPMKREPREFNPDFNALLAAIDVHPRNLDDDPLPLFLRKPRPVFLRALLELGGVR